MKHCTRAVWLLAFAGCFLAVASLSGCGGDDGLAQVSGRVTLDNQPLPEAIVTFTPRREGGGSPSSGVTDEDGRYVLTYSRNSRGAEFGEHLVTISTYREADPDSDPPTAEIPEKVPAKYATGLVREVKPGRNVHDFELANSP